MSFEISDKDMEDSADSNAVAKRSCDEQEETSTLVVTELKPTEWTDEKHSLYLKSMEATFVHQLYKSSSLGRHLQRNGPSGSKPSKHKHASIHAPSSQFKVLRDGCWSKIEFKRDEAEVNQEDAGVLLSNPWIQHYRCPESPGIRKVSTSCAKASLSSTSANQYPTLNFQLWRQDSVGSNTEVTDQNFVDEEDKSERIHAMKRTSMDNERIHETKRTKPSADNVSSNDQVVPFEITVQVDAAGEDHGHPGD